MIVGVALVVAAGGGAYAYSRLGGSACADADTVNTTLHVAASADHFPVLTSVAQSWVRDASGVDGECFDVAVHSMPPATVARNLGDTWDDVRDGPRPDAWAPDSTSWLLTASAREAAAKLLPQQAPSLASSPVILAMQRPMAEALGWPDKPLGWAELLAAFASGQTWADHGHPEWGPLRLGMVDPATSTVGQAGVLSALDPDSDADMSPEELFRSVGFAKLVAASAPDTDTLLQAQLRATQSGPGADHAAVFPVLERDLADFLTRHPQVPLVPIYPSEGATYADYPFATLRADWVTPAKQRIASGLLQRLQSEVGRDAYAQAGFRDTAFKAANLGLLSPQRGFQANPPGQPQTLTAQRLAQLMGMWQVLQMPNNVLLALDTSGSMNRQVPGVGITRLQMLQRAALEGIGLLNNQTSLGLWEFSAKLTLTTDHRELVPLGPAGEKVGEATRREAMVAAINGLRANGGTGLYDTLLAGYLTLRDNWQQGANNLLVLITDGKNEDDLGLTLDQLLHQLRGAAQPDKPLLVIGIAVGPEADAAALEAVTKVTGGRVFVARDEVSAIQQIVLAFAGRISDR